MTTKMTPSTFLRRPVPPTHLQANCDAMDLQQFADECALAGFHGALCALHSRQVGDAVFAVLTRQADRPNGQLAPGFSKQVVSKIVNRVLRGLDLLTETPATARTTARTTDITA